MKGNLKIKGIQAEKFWRLFIIEKDWDLDKFIQKLPQQILYSIEDKVDKILDKLE